MSISNDLFANLDPLTKAELHYTFNENPIAGCKLCESVTIIGKTRDKKPRYVAFCRDRHWLKISANSLPEVIKLWNYSHSMSGTPVIEAL